MSFELQPEHAALIQESAGFSQLGDHAHAWELLDRLPAEKRGHPQVLMARLMAGTGLKRWLLVDHLAGMFADGTDDQQRLAGNFYLERARALLAEGRASDAWEDIYKMHFCWPQGRMEIVNDRVLSNALYLDAGE